MSPVSNRAAAHALWAIKDTRVQMANEERASGKDRVAGYRARLLSGTKGPPRL